MMRILISLIILSLLWGCTPDKTTPVPRRRAFPRVQIPDTAFTRLNGLPLLLSVNKAQPVLTEMRSDGSVWLTVEYPAYGARILCTFTPVDENTIGSVLDNRYERMSLNAGAGTHTMDEFDNPGGYHSSILRSQPTSATPLQFISARRYHPRWVVSGSVFFENASPKTSADSVRPVIEIMHGEVIKMLKSIQNPQP